MSHSGSRPSDEVIDSPLNPLNQGLVDFYSSQADLLLAQFKNINQLLGRTTHHSHPGTHCEVLLRDLLRRTVLPWMCVDKGYIHGRTVRQGREEHSPEIDILIHDTRDFRPLFRLEDFVIIQPEAAIGLIQVKRTFSGGQLRTGIENVADAREHIVSLLSAGGGIDTVDDVRPVFSAVVAFDETSPGGCSPQRYSTPLSLIAARHPVFVPGDRGGLGLSMLPKFVGSLNGTFALSLAERAILANAKEEFAVYESKSDGRNVAVQALLATLTTTLWHFLQRKPPFAFPENMRPVGRFAVNHTSHSGTSLR
jgi:uncharacterized protein DUF6602